jgi:Zinc carboxypeptidase
MKSSIAIVLGLVFAISIPGNGFAETESEAGVRTPYEKSGGLDTPRYDETVSWCTDLAASSELLEFGSFGFSPRGRPLPLVIADLRGRFTPQEHKGRTDHTVLLVEACIHAGESCGKDAGMILLRDLVEDPALAAQLLEKVTLLFIPIFNVDGHERFGPHGRINQNGPREMGWRVTAQNLNLNRDFLKADTPELRHWLALFNAWQPDFFVDIHSTDGADYQYALTYGLETRGNLESGLTDWVTEYRDTLNTVMTADGYPLAPYVSFRDWHDPRSGLEAWAAGPRFSQGYAAIRNRPALLVETHMLKEYPIRVESTRLLLHHTLVWLNAQTDHLLELVAKADQFTAGAAFRAQPFPLDFEASETARPLDFLGVEYEPLTSDITGGDYFRFSDRPETFTVEYFDDLLPSVTADLPEAYIIPPEWTEVIDRLQWHGVRHARLHEPVELIVRSMKFTNPSWRERPYEGRHPVTFSVEPLSEKRIYPAGSVVVPMDQPLARVAAHLLEPEGPDSLVQWGFFDQIFERVEYVESYVIEKMIPDLLAADPKLVEELAAKKAADPEFAADPWAIRYWFYEKTPFYDQRVGIYPIGWLDGDVSKLPID